MLSLDTIRQHMTYDPFTGHFTWIEQPSPLARVHAGDRAGGLTGEGYVSIRYAGKAYQAHRLAWFFVNGTMPAGLLDHINGDRADNRIANLRLATRQQNAFNQRGRGLHGKGVSRLPSGRYKAQLRSGAKHIYLGAFDTPEQAHSAYCAAAQKLFGEFARFE